MDTTGESTGTGFFPDGLTLADIDQLITEAETLWSDPQRPTSTLLDGSAALRRERRIARREMAAVARAFPVCAAEREREAA